MFSDDASKAIARKTDHRGQRSILEGVMYELPTVQGVAEVVVNAEVVEGQAAPLLIWTEKKAVSRARRGRLSTRRLS
jgi:ATP-dependent Clp protease ATP-binding subunit ClpX